MRSTFFIAAFLLTLQTFAQPEPWIAYPSASVSDYGVYHFRKSLVLDSRPDRFVVHVSADNRYKLFVNGSRVCYGPAKGDLQTYKYDVVDIAPYMVEGKNVLAALVYNGGKDKALALQSVQTAFLLRAEDQTFEEVNTNTSWKVMKNPAYAPVSYYEMLFEERWFYGFYACGPGDRVDAGSYPWGWETPEYDDSQWKQAELLSFDGDAPWKLVPRNIAYMDDHHEYPASIRLAEGVSGSDAFLKGTSPIKVPAHSKARVLFDFGIFTMGYPDLKLSGGNGSSVKLKYAEALYEEVNLKAHRDSVNGLTMYGVWDVFSPDGQERSFSPLWKRAFRYLMLEIETGAEELRVLGLESEYSGYPYPEMSTFESSDATLNEIFEISLRTLRMCSGETYYDTPFYEQLSYGGDNRPISALSTYNSTDDRLLREVMRLYPQSVNSETRLFKSAYPSRFTFDMGSWSLAWIQSLHDYYFMRGDAEYVKQFMEDMEGVLGFYHRHIDESLGILGDINSSNFIDWSISTGSIPRRDDEGIMRHSTLLTLYYAHSLDCIVRLYRAFGMEEKTAVHEQEAKGIKAAVLEHCYNPELKMFADRPGGDTFSQHSNLMAILSDVVDPAAQKALMERILEYPEFDERASSYFSFFLFKAMKKTGMEDAFLEHLDFWKHFIERGHTTCGETGFASHDRSDCHAWSAHPAYYMLSLVCGIEPADTGFKRVRIEPHLGSLGRVKADMPHPLGRIAVEYEQKRGKLQARINLPDGMTGTFHYGNREFALEEGMNEFKIKAEQ